MSNTKLTDSYWQNRYEKGEIGWDMGQLSPPLKAYFDQLTDKKARILIPGCGNAHEAAYLHEQGFTNVFLLDWAKAPLKAFHEQHPDFNQNHLLHINFFEFNTAASARFDLIIEQTFFCAINPSLRPAYVQQCAKLLKPTGKLVGLLFNIPLYEDHPPYGGQKEEYEKLFSTQFHIHTMETCYNSISPRAGNELFLKLLAK